MHLLCVNCFPHSHLQEHLAQLLDAVIAYNKSGRNETDMEKVLTDLRGTCKDKHFCSEVEQAVCLLPSVVSPIEGRREKERDALRIREIEDLNVVQLVT